MKATSTNAKPTGIVVCLPTRGAVSIETMLCLRERLDSYPNFLITAIRQDVVTARNSLAESAREIDVDNLLFDPEFVLWVDDDAWWGIGTLDRAVTILRENPEVPVVAGVFSDRKANSFPCVVRVVPPEEPTGATTLKAVPFTQDEPSRVFEIGNLGLHWFLMRREALNALGDEPFNRMTFAEVLPGYTQAKGQPKADSLASEDMSFCKRLRDAGLKIVTEQTLLVGHVDAETGLIYFPFAPAYQSKGLSVPTEIVKDAPPSKVRRYFADPDVWKLDLPKVA